MTNQTSKTRIIIWCTTTVLISSLLIYGSYIGFDVMLSQEDFKIKKDEVSFNLPVWLSDKGKEKIRDIVLSQNGQYLYQENITNNVALICKQYPIIKRVIHVKREFPNKIRIAFELRKPISEIRDNGNIYLVDNNGVRLPRKYYNWPINNKQNPYILARRVKGVPSSGKQWNDKRILAGVDLIRFLKKNNADRKLGISKIDVSNVGKRYSSKKSDIILWTKGGTEIKWGCSPLCRIFDELSDVEKLRNLYSVASEVGANFKNMEYVDVRWAKPTGKRVHKKKYM